MVAADSSLHRFVLVPDRAVFQDASLARDAYGTWLDRRQAVFDGLE